MATIFVLQHLHETGDGEDVKLVGVYSSRQKAQDAASRLSLAPGFAAAPNGFHIDEYRLDQDQWSEGYATVAGGTGTGVAEPDTGPKRPVQLR